jgi:hypothetical protein
VYKKNGWRLNPPAVFCFVNQNLSVYRKFNGSYSLVAIYQRAEVNTLLQITCVQDKILCRRIQIYLQNFFAEQIGYYHFNIALRVGYPVAESSHIYGRIWRRSRKVIGNSIVFVDAKGNIIKEFETNRILHICLVKKTISNTA